ncbi:MAG: tRNA (adenosine(37)-N6)-threonylcarbamoyltransferase complex ATPase subunit type 1 TsaE [Candidatus Melainabacteria bacterium]|nr:tRNA (adenosine(37)-N6)-threonylcarbamoyltransferase complex ATPase subunit type 1 TsaE [Candidatus Melainabacteria bacterium]
MAGNSTSNLSPLHSTGHSEAARVWSLHSLDDLSRWCQAWARQLQPGDVIALDGPLGAGKTTLVQQLALALGVQQPVTSPTFSLIHEYLDGHIPLLHTDLYRLDSGRPDASRLDAGPTDEAFADALWDRFAQLQGILLVEWACYGSFMPAWQTAAITLEAHTPRTLTLKTFRPGLMPESLWPGAKEPPA